MRAGPGSRGRLIDNPDEEPAGAIGGQPAAAHASADQAPTDQAPTDQVPADQVPTDQAGDGSPKECPEAIRQYLRTLDTPDEVPPVYLANLTGAVIWSNAAFRRLASSFLESSGLAVGRAPSMETILAAIARAGLPATREDTISTSGGIRSYRSSHAPVLDAAGILQGVVGHFENVSELQEARRQLRAAQDRLDDVMRLSSEWLWEVDPNLKLVFVSHRVTELLGMPPEALIGRRLLDLGFFQVEPGEDPTPLDPQKRVPFRDRAFSMQHADGRTRHFRLASLPVFHREEGSFKGFRGTARDVTKEIEAERTIETSRTQLRQAIDSISEGFALYDQEDRLVLCNDVIRGFYPHAADAIYPGAHFDDIARAVSLGDVVMPDGQVAWLDRRIALRNKFTGFVEVKLTDGRWLRSSDRRTEDGGSVGIRTDITELKRREEALTHAKELAESANRAKTEFLANISHELRTPLNAIIGFSEIVRDELFGPIGNDKYREYMSDVLHSAKHLLSVINDILDLSKAEAGKLDLVEETVSISVLVESGTRLVRDRADRAEVSIRSVLDTELPLLFGDRRKLLQVLLNLLTNAIKFTPSGGVIEIRAGIDMDGDLELSVSDTGIGMAPEHIETALAPFGQVDSTLTRRFEGTGLGLPLTWSMVELHQGTLSIESEFGHGTKVTVRLPAHRYR